MHTKTQDQVPTRRLSSAERASLERRKIAQLTGISVHTINAHFALRTRHRVAPATRQQIESAAREIGYEPPMRATKGAALIGYQIPRPWDVDQVDNDVFARLLIALLGCLEEQNMRLRIFGGQPEPQDGSAAARRSREERTRHQLEDLYRSDRVDAFVFDDPVVDDRRIAHAQATGIPYIVAGSPVTLDPSSQTLKRPGWAAEWPCVDVDDALGFEEITRIAIVIHGHSELLHVRFDDDATFPGIRRAAGVAKAARGHGAKVTEVRINYNATSAEAVGRLTHILNRPNMFTAAICDCDRFALYVRHVAGQPFTVYGCDDDHLRRTATNPWVSLALKPRQQAKAMTGLLQQRLISLTSTRGEQDPVTVLPEIVGLTSTDLRDIRDRQLDLRCLTSADEQSPSSLPGRLQFSRPTT